MGCCPHRRASQRRGKGGSFPKGVGAGQVPGAGCRAGGVRTGWVRGWVRVRPLPPPLKTQRSFRDGATAGQQRPRAAAAGHGGRGRDGSGTGQGQRRAEAGAGQPHGDTPSAVKPGWSLSWSPRPRRPAPGPATPVPPPPGSCAHLPPNSRAVSGQGLRGGDSGAGGMHEAPLEPAGGPGAVRDTVWAHVGVERAPPPSATTRCCPGPRCGSPHSVPACPSLSQPVPVRPTAPPRGQPVGERGEPAPRGALFLTSLRAPPPGWFLQPLVTAGVGLERGRRRR